MNGWEQVILQICRKENIEMYPAATPEGRAGYIFYRAEPLKENVIKQIREAVPEEITVGFKYQDKPSTIPALLATILVSGARRPPLFKAEDKHLTIDIYDLEEERVDRMKIDTILEQDGFFQSWTVNVKGQELYEMNLVGRRLALEIQKNKHVREQVLTDSDVADLKISLETCNSVDEFIKTLEG